MCRKRNGMALLRWEERGLRIKRACIGALASLDRRIVCKIVGDEEPAPAPARARHYIGLLAEIAAICACADLRGCRDAFKIAAKDYIDHARDGI